MLPLQRGPLASFLLKAILQHKKGLRHLAIDSEEHYVLAVAAVLHSMMTLLGPFTDQHT